MKLPKIGQTLALSDYQFRLLITLCQFKASEGTIDATIPQLAVATGGVNEKTVRRALVALERGKFIRRVRTKRSGGFRGPDKYILEDWRTLQSYSLEDANVHATHDYSSPSHTVDKPLVPNNQDSNKLKDFEPSVLKEIKIPMKGYHDDDDLAGFGLIEEKDAPQPKIRKTDPKTRGKRPESEWTPMDVAAEFSYRVGKKYPLLPGTVNVYRLSGALAKFRKQYGTTPLIELELLKLFMADERNFKEIGDEAPFLYKKYLSSFGTKMNQARENLGLNKITAKVDTTDKTTTLVASDGRVFQNSLSGRTQLARHEEKLRGQK